MRRAPRRMPEALPRPALPASSDLFLFLFFFLVLLEVFLVFFLFLDFVLFFLVFVVEVVGNGIYMDGMRLRDFQFGFTFGAAQDFALLYFVLIHVNFGATIGAANHGTILRTILVQVRKQT